MAITENPPERIDLTTFRLSWSSDRTPPVTCRVYREGALVSTQTSSTGDFELIVGIPSGDHPYFEILDKDCQVSGIAFPGRMTMQWTRVSGAETYRVDEYVSGDWTERKTYLDDGSGAYTYLSRWLEDVTQHQFRVVPIGSDGNDGTEKDFTFIMVRHPDEPAVEYAYDSGTAKVTITAA